MRAAAYCTGIGWSSLLHGGDVGCPLERARSLSSLFSRLQVSLNIQKFAHMKNEALGDNRQPYHKIPLWWCGMAVNAVGEVGNLVAYGYAEATVVTPIGAVGVIFSAVIATFLLKEQFQR